MRTDAIGTEAPIGYSAVPRGHVAAVVTYLDMRRRPAPWAPRPFPRGLVLQPLRRPTLERYRALYRAIGQDWLWASRLLMPDDELRSIIEDARVDIFALRQDTDDVGILELDFRQPGACELAFFGLVESAIGKGIGRALMNEAIERAWSRPIERLWVHTCTLDHPAAVDFYRRSGFEPYAVKVEVQVDPRLVGVIPRHFSPRVPLLE